MNLSIPILVLIIIILIIHIFQWLDDSIDRIYYNILIKDLVDNVKTGDLVLFKNGINIPVNTIVGSNKFSHSGIVVIINGKPYVYELISNMLGKYICHKNLKMAKTHVQLFPLSDRIKHYAGECYIASLSTPLNQAQIEKMVKFMENNKDHRFMNYVKWLPIIFTNRLLEKESFCHEFVAKILCELNISDEPIKSKKITLTKTLMNLCNGKTYSVPVRVIPEDLLLKKNLKYSSTNYQP